MARLFSLEILRYMLIAKKALVNITELTILFMLQNPALATAYTGHNNNATVAAYSPSGYYIASGGNKAWHFFWLG
jgi:hypothetical protein